MPDRFLHHNSGRRVLHPELVKDTDFSEKVARGASKLILALKPSSSQQGVIESVRSIIFEVGRNEGYIIFLHSFFGFQVKFDKGEMSIMCVQHAQISSCNGCRSKTQVLAMSNVFRFFRNYKGHMSATFVAYISVKCSIQEVQYFNLFIMTQTQSLHIYEVRNMCNVRNIIKIQLQNFQTEQLINSTQICGFCFIQIQILQFR
ncbi:Hypothetical_protein [Hexamita inflata]|uniref:Hypothetical_protein n=1 Tax=Hexamita inflata TaxID=28002 RepID=A0AA86QY34_9EUKA|nr:Hypothetical protein HINF_LOCUS53953 [Hexamita inflata]